jgi:hypothetical protein
MRTLRITAGPHAFAARMEEERAPRTCAAFRSLLPFRQKLIHARWSGEACWIPLGGLELAVGPENSVSQPSPGQILLYPGGQSETEILFPYGISRFACKDGPLSGNAFLTVLENAEGLTDLGRLVLWQGAQNISFEET